MSSSRFTIFLLVGFTLVSNIALAGDIGAKKNGPAFREGELIIKFKPGVTSKKRESNRKKIGANTKRKFPKLGIEHLQLKPGKSVKESIAELMATGEIEYAEPNYLVTPSALPDDPQASNDWAIKNTGATLIGGTVTTTAGFDMNLENAWTLTQGSHDVIVAVVDDAIDIYHPDLAANIWTNPNEIPDNGIDDDNNGFIDDVHGWDIVNNDNNPTPDNTGQSHGTAVAGRIGAVGDNGIGTVGAAWNVSIMPIKFGFDTVGQITAYEYAISNGAQIINASFGGPGKSTAVADMIDQMKDAGILLVAGAGNDYVDNDIEQFYPASYDNANIIAVAASNSHGELTSWTQHGQTSVDVAAPGEYIYTTDLQSNYRFASGTSFSSPSVAGIAALVKSFYPDANYLDLKGRIMGSAIKMQDSFAKTATDGFVDAYGSLVIQPQAVISLSSMEIDDSVGGDGDGIAEPGETIKLSVSLTNSWEPANNVEIKLGSLDERVAIIQSLTSIATIERGESDKWTEPFIIELLDGSYEFLDVQFYLDIEQPGAITQRRYFSFETRRGDTLKNLPYSHVGTIDKITTDEGTTISSTDIFNFRIVDTTQVAISLESASEDVDLDINLRDAYVGAGQPLFSSNNGSGIQDQIVEVLAPGLYSLEVYSKSLPRLRAGYKLSIETTPLFEFNEDNVFEFVSGDTVVVDAMVKAINPIASYKWYLYSNSGPDVEYDSDDDVLRLVPPAPDVYSRVHYTFYLEVTDVNGYTGKYFTTIFIDNPITFVFASTNHDVFSGSEVYIDVRAESKRPLSSLVWSICHGGPEVEFAAQGGVVQFTAPEVPSDTYIYLCLEATDSLGYSRDLMTRVKISPSLPGSIKNVVDQTGMNGLSGNTYIEQIVDDENAITSQHDNSHTTSQEVAAGSVNLWLLGFIVSALSIARVRTEVLRTIRFRLPRKATISH